MLQLLSVVQGVGTPTFTLIEDATGIKWVSALNTII